MNYTRNLNLADAQMNHLMKQSNHQLNFEGNSKLTLRGIRKRNFSIDPSLSSHRIKGNMVQKENARLYEQINSISNRKP